MFRVALDLNECTLRFIESFFLLEILSRLQDDLESLSFEKKKRRFCNGNINEAATNYYYVNMSDFWTADEIKST